MNVLRATLNPLDSGILTYLSLSFLLCEKCGKYTYLTAIVRIKLHNTHKTLPGTVQYLPYKGKIS
jgi:hypothetical protein